MSFLSILFALLLEQARPLQQGNPVHLGVRIWVRWVVRNLDTSKQHHAWLAWCVAVVAPAILVFGVHWLLVWSVGWIAAAAWSIAILYAT
jgi:adenosylcobinamide-phosphate synthase